MKAEAKMSAEHERGCPGIKRLSHNPIIKQLSDTFICFQPHINIMAFIRRLRNQNWLFPPTIADLIEEDHIYRLVDDVVERIDFKSIEEKYDGPGSPAYHPKVMMKLLIQGTIDGIRSSRKIYRVRAKTVERLFRHVKQNIGLREFLTRGLQGVRAEFSLACIAHNFKRIWTIKSQTKAIGANSAKNGRIDQSSLKNLCRSIKGVWFQILSSFSKGLSIYQVYY